MKTHFLLLASSGQSWTRIWPRTLVQLTAEQLWMLLTLSCLGDVFSPVLKAAALLACTFLLASTFSRVFVEQTGRT